ERVEQDAPYEHAPSPEAIGEVAAEQAEGAAEDRRHPEEHPDPEIEIGHARLVAGELADGGPDDERGHQDFVDVEGEAESGNGADQPLQGSETTRGRCHATARSIREGSCYRAIRVRCLLAIRSRI